MHSFELVEGLAGGQAEVTLLAEGRFMVSDELGDVVPGTPHGFYAADTRFLSSYVLRLNGQRLRALAAWNVGRGGARFYATNQLEPDLEQGGLTLVRERHLDGAVHDDLLLTNHSGHSVQVELALSFDADFRDIFEVRQIEGEPAEPAARHAWEPSGLVFRDGYDSRTAVTFSEPPQEAGDGSDARFALELAPQDSWRLSVSITPSAGPREQRAEPPVSSGPGQAPGQASSHLWHAPTLVTDDWTLEQAYDQAVRDLHGLEMVTEAGHRLLAAGLPWFVALFGRDTLLTAYQTLLLGPELAVSALDALAAFQATEQDAFRDADPGKMPHEVRSGRLARLGRLPHGRYYGTVDATPLWLVLLSETYRWTGDLELVRRLLPIAEAALTWIDEYADLDGDGFVEYARRSPGGLDNQGWKDSWDAIRFADGRLAEGPIALVEVQGYVYDARLRLAELFEALGETQRAAALRAQAETLKRAFNDAFWLPGEGYYALALDAHKRPVDSITSNPGHALWSGIVDAGRAGQVAERLMSDELFSGWGLRTMSSRMLGYSPVAYHNGSVWPHDTALVAAGLARYGFVDAAGRLLRGLVEASAGFARHRLPELFCGFQRRPNDLPVAYPAANSPQAWAAGSVVLVVRTLLGIEPSGAELASRPLPGAPRCRLLGVPFRGRRLTLRSGGRFFRRGPRVTATDFADAA